MSLAESNIEYIKQNGQSLVPNTDETLWFVQDKPTGKYIFEVKTKMGEIYIATLDWVKSASRNSSADENLNDLTVVELKAIAKEKGVVGYSNMTKQQLIDIITTTP